MPRTRYPLLREAACLATPEGARGARAERGDGLAPKGDLQGGLEIAMFLLSNVNKLDVISRVGRRQSCLSWNNKEYAC